VVQSYRLRLLFCSNYGEQPIVSTSLQRMSILFLPHQIHFPSSDPRVQASSFGVTAPRTCKYAESVCGGGVGYCPQVLSNCRIVSTNYILFIPHIRYNVKRFYRLIPFFLLRISNFDPLPKIQA